MYDEILNQYLLGCHPTFLINTIESSSLIFTMKIYMHEDNSKILNDKALVPGFQSYSFSTFTVINDSPNNQNGDKE